MTGSGLHFKAEGNVPLEGDFDLDTALSRIYPSARAKGMFLAPLAEKLGPGFRDLEPRLEAPPRGGKYVAYVDYPSRDHIRLIDAAARATLPRLSPREAHRRLGRGAFASFAESHVGRVVLKLVASDPKELLLAFPRGYGMSVRSRAAVEATALSGPAVRIIFGEPVAVPEYLLGIMEGIVTRFAKTPSSEVRADDARPQFDVSWDA